FGDRGLGGIGLGDVVESSDEPLPRGSGSVIRAEPVPLIQRDALRGELDRALAGKVAQDRVERLVFGDSCLEGLLALEAGGDLQGLAAVLAEAREDTNEKRRV